MKNLIVSLILWGFYVNMYSQTPNINFNYTLKKSSNTTDIGDNLNQTRISYFKEYAIWKKPTDTITKIIKVYKINTDNLNSFVIVKRAAISNPNNIEAYSAHFIADAIKKVMVDLDSNKKNLREYTATIAVTGLENKEEIDLYEYYYEKLDSLRKCYRAINKIYGSPAFWNRFLPARTKVGAAMIYNRYGNKFTQVGQNISLYGWSNKGSVNAELFSTYLKGAKLSINTVVSSVDTAQDNAALLRTITGGAGNFIVNLNIPLYHCLNKGTKFFVEFSPNFASNIPLLGTPFKSSDLFFNSNLGANLSFSFRVAENSKISIYGYARPSYIVGSNSYLNEMNITSDFWLFQGQLGLDIPEVGRFGWSLPAFSSNSSISTNTMLLSFQVSPMSIVGK